MKLSTEWYQRKTEQIQQSLDTEKIDGILLLDPFNVYYATGFFHQSTERPLGFYIPQQGEPRFLVPYLEKEMAEATWVKQVSYYFDFPGDPPVLQWMLDHISEKHIGIDKLGIREWRSMQTMGKQLSMTDLVYTMRLVKDPEEIEILDTASIYADYMVEMAREGILNKMTETNAFHFARDETVKRMKRELGELTFVNQGLVNGAILYGPHSAHPHGLMGDRLPQAGESIEAAFGALVYTYESESEHTFLYGEPSKQTVSYFNAMYAAWKAGMEAAKPGVTCAEVNEASLNAIREAGYEQYLRHRMGHGKGLQEHEAPWVEAGDFTVLKPGMVISDEPGLYVPGYGGFRHSDTLVITETGCRRMTKFPRDLESCILPIR